MEAHQPAGDGAQDDDRLDAAVERPRQRPVEPLEIAGRRQARDRIGGGNGGVADAGAGDLHRQRACISDVALPPGTAQIDGELLDLVLDLAAVAAQALGEPADGLGLDREAAPGAKGLDQPGGAVRAFVVAGERGQTLLPLAQQPETGARGERAGLGDHQAIRRVGKGEAGPEGRQKGIGDAAQADDAPAAGERKRGRLVRQAARLVAQRQGVEGRHAERIVRGAGDGAHARLGARPHQAFVRAVDQHQPDAGVRGRAEAVGARRRDLHGRLPPGRVARRRLIA